MMDSVTRARGDSSTPRWLNLVDSTDACGSNVMWWTMITICWTSVSLYKLRAVHLEWTQRETFSQGIFGFFRRW